MPNNMLLRNTVAKTTGTRPPGRSSWPTRTIGGAAVFAVALLASASAYAVSEKVKSACRDDYFQHCSQYAVGSDELRQCMRKVGEDLSAPCLVALVEDGQITKEDVERHNAAKAAVGEKPSASRESAANEPVDPKTLSGKPTKKHKSAAKDGKTKQVIAADDAVVPPVAAQSRSSSKSAKSNKTGSKTKAGAHKSSTGKTVAATKKKGTAKAKSTSSASASAAAGGTTVATPAKAGKAKTAHKTTHAKKPTAAKSAAVSKSKSTPTATKTKKTATKKSATKKAAKPAAAQTP
jgi:hypothetical protein